MSNPDQFTKKPVTIDAILWTGENVKEVMDFLQWRNADHDERTGLVIRTLEGSMSAAVGDYIIKGVKGEFYPCKPDIFEATYSPAVAPTEAAAMAATVPDPDGEAFRTAARLGLTLRMHGGCAQSSMPGSPSAYEVVTAADPAAAMREAVARAEAVIANGGESQRLQAPVAGQPAEPSPPYGLTPEQIGQLLRGSLKPEEINGEPDVRHKRVRELLHWFARFQEGHANPKWAKDHAMELAYYIATTGPQREVNVSAINQAGYLEGLRASPEDRAMMERIGALAAPKGDSNG